MHNIIIFEQPVNELMRVCLRLEHLFQQATHHLQGASIWDTQASLSAIIDILAILERPDLKSKLTQELSRHLANLSRLEHLPHIDTQKLASVLLELEDLLDMLHAANGKLGQALRENEFINTFRQYQMSPGGSYSMEMPAYTLWLQQPAADRKIALSNWLHSLQPYLATIKLLLRLARHSHAPTAKVAHNGFFQVSLDPQTPCQLIRVAIDSTLRIYPLISVSRHGICIRFFEFNLTERASQTQQTILFQFTTCII